MRMMMRTTTLLMMIMLKRILDLQDWMSLVIEKDLEES